MIPGIQDDVVDQGLLGKVGMEKRLGVERCHTDDQGRHRDHLQDEVHHHFLVDDLQQDK